jgi:hypothetical protein
MWTYILVITLVNILVVMSVGLSLLAIRFAAEWHEEKNYKPRMRSGR